MQQKQILLCLGKTIWIFQYILKNPLSNVEAGWVPNFDSCLHQDFTKSKEKKFIEFLFRWKLPCDVQSSGQRVVNKGKDKRLCGKSPIASSP